jgi:predicted metalloprotease
MVRRRLVIALVVSVVAAVGGYIAPAGAARPSHENGRVTKPQFEKLAKAAIADIQAYWSETLPAAYGIEYEGIPSKRIRAYDKNSPPSTYSKCITKGEKPPYYTVAKATKRNASYCVLDDTVIYDIGTLFPELTKQFGKFAPVLVLAHEWGHAIQARVETEEEFFSEAPGASVLKETQADCFAGAWVGWVEAGKSERFKFDERELDTALAGLEDFKDPIGSDPTAPQAHGNGFDRTNAFQLGVEGGAARCKAWDTNPPGITQIPFANPQEAAGGTNLPFDEVVPSVRTDLDAYGAQLVPGYQPIKVVKAYDSSDPSSVPKCGGDTLTSDEYKDNALYCIADDYIAYDQKLARSTYDDIGDFALAWLISFDWGVAIQERLVGQAVLIRADCFSGAWAGSLATGGHPSQLQLSPDDLDKVVQAFLALSESAGVPAADRTTGTAFQRLQAFRAGFFSTNPVGDCLALGPAEIRGS